jgi:hypothetical protein
MGEEDEQRRLREIYDEINTSGHVPDNVIPTMVKNDIDDKGRVVIILTPEIAPELDLEVEFHYSMGAELTDPKDQLDLWNFVHNLPSIYKQCVNALYDRIQLLDEVEGTDFSDIKPEDITG